jgi:predicted amidohydrolase YtcJ
MYHDHHFHPLGYARLVNGLDLMQASSVAEILHMVAVHSKTVEGAVIAQRFNDERLAERRLPSRSDIDDVISDRPVILYRYCGHVAVANSAALALAGIDSATPDPPGGGFDRDATGRPDGILRETAVGVVGKAVAPHARPPSDFQVLAALEGLLDHGLGSLTGIVAASDPLWCGVGDELETLCRLAPSLPIDIEVYATAASPEELTLAAERVRRADGRLRFAGWKDWMDGSFGGHTAAMYQPYADRPDATGTIRLDLNHAYEMAQTSLGLGGGVALHAIGDRANDLVLDIHERLIAEAADPASLRIEHASILTESAIARAARLGVTASVQPAFLVSEEGWLVKRLGEVRLEMAYPFRSLLEAGVMLLGGSDCPVETPDPQVGIEAAVTRHGINPKEALTREQAEAIFTPPRA